MRRYNTSNVQQTILANCNGVVTALNVEQPGEYAVSSAEAMLEKL